MRVGDLVVCREPSLEVYGLGLVVQIENYSDDTDLSVCVQWNNSWYWYHEGDLRIVNEI